MNREVEVERFLAKTYSGKQYTIVQYQEYYIPDDFVGRDEVKGQIIYLTSDKLIVNKIDAKTFQIAETNEVVMKV
jgi:hypothetical protein